MTTQTVTFIDKDRNLLATARVVDEGTYYGGVIDLTPTPARLRALFDEFEEIVNGQMLSFLDDIQSRLDALAIQVVLVTGSSVPVRDLQVYPSTGDVSFKLGEREVPGARLASQAAPPAT